MAKQDEQVERVSGEVELYDRQLFGNLISQDPEAVMARFAEQFMAAKTVEEVFAVLDGNSATRLYGEVVEIRSVAWAPYQTEDGVIPNAIIEAVNMHTGEQVQFSNTGRLSNMQLRRVELIGGLPLKVRVVGKRTAGGQTATNFELV
jgi:hypothetical protein